MSSKRNSPPLGSIDERNNMTSALMDSLHTESLDNESFIDQSGTLEQVHSLPSMNTNMSGEFFEAVFLNGKSRTDRQRKTVLQ